MPYDRVPEELKARRQWVLWRMIQRGDDKPTKVPFQTSGRPAKVNDASTWCSFDQAARAVSDAYAGIGYVFSTDDPYCGIDLDGCIGASGMQAWAAELVRTLPGYAEISPSGAGVKLWTRGDWTHQGHRAMVGADPVCDKAPGVEVYSDLRWFAVTGRRLQGMDTIGDGQSALESLHARYFSTDIPTVEVGFKSPDQVLDRARKYIAHLPPSISGQSGHNAAFRCACILVLDFALDESDAMTLLREWNGCCQPPWSEKELLHKVRSANKQAGPRGKLRDAAPENWAKIKTPEYVEPKEAPSTASVTTLKDAALKYLETRRKSGSLLIETGIPELDYAIGGGAEPGEMFILAGRPSHGKSAIALQMVHHWTASGIPCAFISEEMSAIALGKRTVQFASPVPEEHWDHRMDQVHEGVVDHFRGRAECMVVEYVRSASAAAETMRRAVDEIGARCIVVDYAQLLSASGKSRYEQVCAVSIALRQAANSTGVLLIALAQLNREIEARSTYVPKMSDLRDAGQLEQDADVVAFGVWPHRVNPKQDPYGYQFFVAKNRNRPINAPAFQVRFEASRQRFVETPMQPRASSRYIDSFAEEPE